MAETIFDKIIAKQMDADIVYEDDVVLAFKDINPQAPVHVLVLPKNKMQGFIDFKDADPEEIGVYLKDIAKVASELGLEKDGYRIVFNHGKNGQQSVDYVHAHILGGRQMKWPPG